MKPGASAGAMPENVSLSDAGDGHRRVGEGGGRREPIGRADIEADRRGKRIRPETETAENGRDQPERGDEFAEPLAEAGPRRRRKLDRLEAEHQMRRHRAETSARDLRHDIEQRRTAFDLAAEQHHQRHRRIELGARNRNEDGDDDDQDRGGGDRVAEKGKRDISPGQILGHDARADHRHDEKERAERLGRQAPRQIDLH